MCVCQKVRFYYLLHPFFASDVRRILIVHLERREILCDQLDLEEEQVNEDSEVIDDLGADSLDIVDLVMTLEEEFDTEIPDEDIENLKTVGDIVKYIEDRVAE